MVTHAMGIDQDVERVLATGELPDVPFEPGAPVPVAFWDQIVFFIVRHKDGSFHYLAAEPGGTVSGGSLGDELPDRTGVELYATVGMGGAEAVLGFAPLAAETVRLERAGSTAGVNPRNGAFVIGVTGIGTRHVDRLIAEPIGVEADVQFGGFDLPLFADDG
jgi:hypothetical protein